MVKTVVFCLLHYCTIYLRVSLGGVHKKRYTSWCVNFWITKASSVSEVWFHFCDKTLFSWKIQCWTDFDRNQTRFNPLVFPSVRKQYKNAWTHSLSLNITVSEKGFFIGLRPPWTFSFVFCSSFWFKVKTIKL